MYWFHTTFEDDNDIEVEIEVGIIVHPAEQMTRDYPGCDAEPEIQSITIIGPEDYPGVDQPMEEDNLLEKLGTDTKTLLADLMEATI